MNRRTARFLAFLACCAGAPIASAYESYNHFPQGTEVQQCYSHAMVGMDSVINSRIGVPAEHALDLARMSKVASGENNYSTYLLGTILNAYLWEGSPHSYAITVFYKCAQENSPSKLVSSPLVNLSAD